MAMNDVIKQARLDKNITQSDISDKINVTTDAYQKMEKGKNSINKDYIKPICDALDMPYVNLLSEICPIFKNISDINADEYASRSRDHLVCVYSNGRYVYDLRLSDEEYAFLRLLSDYTGLLESDIRLCDIVAELIKYRGYAIEQNDRLF